MSFQPPVPPGTNPYTRTSSVPGARPKWTRKRVLFPAAGLLFFVGVGLGASGDPAQGAADAQNASKAKPAPTVTVTETATVTVTARPRRTPPQPTPTVTETLRVTVPPEPEPAPAHADRTADDASNGSAEKGTSRTPGSSVRSDTSGTGGGAGSGGGGDGDDAPAGTATSYANCTAVRAAGAAPIHRGEPGFGSHLDRDGDGVACE